MKPVMFVANVADDDMDGQSPLASKVREYAAKNACEFVPLCGDIEGEIMKLPPEERGAFLADAGLQEPGLNRLVKKTYDLLGLQTYYTAGKIEIKAWTIHRGDTAPVAAGVIHTDFEKHFIRAEIYSVEDLVALKTEAAIRSAGKLRVEGRDYVMRPRDVAHYLIAK
jgi:ribosome-binding ATPase YchF (GTP1/OBG family)